MSEAVQAAQNEHTIKVTIAFFTDEIADGGKATGGRIIPRHAWDQGNVHIRANASHGIKTDDGVMFNSLDEIQGAVEKVLRKAGITIHPYHAGNRGLSAQSEQL
jgi:FAD/FMN-containing dehydrogenase